jgi:hypothetical protein
MIIPPTEHRCLKSRPNARVISPSVRDYSGTLYRPHLQLPRVRSRLHATQLACRICVRDSGPVLSSSSTHVHSCHALFAVSRCAGPQLTDAVPASTPPPTKQESQSEAEQARDSSQQPQADRPDSPQSRSHSRADTCETGELRSQDSDASSPSAHGASPARQLDPPNDDAASGLDPDPLNNGDGALSPPRFQTLTFDLVIL